MKLTAVAAFGAALFLQGTGWRSSEPSSLQLTSDRPGCLTVRNVGAAGVDLWRARARPITGTYTVKATLRKLDGRRLEGYGLIFGGRNLGTDSARYSYVMVRGDGKLLVKKREGAATPTVRDWTAHSAIRPDDGHQRAENDLEVRVSPQEVVIRVNGVEVARVPSSELFVEGLTGVRISHHLAVEVIGFDEVGRC